MVATGLHCVTLRDIVSACWPSQCGTRYTQCLCGIAPRSKGCEVRAKASNLTNDNR
jgi:hypothetical protein